MKAVYKFRLSLLIGVISFLLFLSLGIYFSIESGDMNRELQPKKYTTYVTFSAIFYILASIIGLAIFLSFLFGILTERHPFGLYRRFKPRR